MNQWNRNMWNTCPHLSIGKFVKLCVRLLHSMNLEQSSLTKCLQFKMFYVINECHAKFFNNKVVCWTSKLCLWNCCCKLLFFLFLILIYTGFAIFFTFTERWLFIHWKTLDTDWSDQIEHVVSLKRQDIDLIRFNHEMGSKRHRTHWFESCNGVGHKIDLIRLICNGIGHKTDLINHGIGHDLIIKSCNGFEHSKHW